MELKPFGLTRMRQEIVMVRTRLLGGASWIRTSVRFAGRSAPNHGGHGHLCRCGSRI